MNPASLSVRVIVAAAWLSTALVFADDPATNAAPAAGPEAVSSLLTDSSQALASGDYELAIRDATLAIQLDPKNPAGYEMRGSVYIEEKLWDRAERDYLSAQKISPDIVYRYKLAQIKFLQKSFVDAKPRFVALESDPNLGDLALYQAFLCDVLSDHQAAALQTLTQLDQAPKTPAYYFCHAAWDLYHGKRSDAGALFAEAGHIYDSSTTDRYVSRLLETQRFRMNQVTFDSKDGQHFDHASVFLEDAGLRIGATKGWITLPLEQLPDDLTTFPADLREQIDRKRAVTPTVALPISLVSFTTRTGKSYDRVRCAVNAGGLSVLTTDGWISVPFAQLPEDLSPFPADLQQTLEQKRQAAPAPLAEDDILTFTTRHGKTYTQLRSNLSRSGVSVLTTDGWVSVPFADLPANLSPFPADWRPLIEAGHASDVDASGTALITFTTRKGKHYDQVRAAIEKSGLRLMTSDGLIAVPFDQLPEDLSVFPQDWRATISQKKTLPLNGRTSSN